METRQFDQLLMVRHSNPSDKAFIFSTWLRGLYYGNSWFREIDKNIFMQNYHKVLEAILSKPGVEVCVACLKEDQETILGYAVIERQRNAIHWVFVKEVWRKFGIAKKLIPKDEKWAVVTHLTSLGKSLKPKEMKFNPFI